MTDSTYPIEITAAFDRSGFNPSLAAGGLDYSTDSNGPLYAYYGHLANNLTLPIGAKGSLAYTTFGSRGELPSKATLSSKVEVMVPQFDCEAAKVTPLSVDYSGWRGAGNSALATFESSSCTIEYVNLRARDPRKSICPPKQLSAVLSLVDCGARRETSGTVAAPWDGVSPDIRFIVAVTDFRYTQTPAYSVIRNETVFNATDFSSSVEGVSGVICKSAYSMLEADLTYDTSEQDESHRFSVSAPHVLSGRLLENFSTDNLSRAVDTAFATSYTMVDRQPSAELDPQSPDLMSKLMLLVAEESSLQIFLDDAETMKSAAAKTLNGVAAQYAQQSLLMPTSEPSTGKLVFVEDRLKVQTTSTILILTCLVLLVLMTAVVLVSRPYDVVPRKSDSLGALSVILSANQNLQSVLADLGRSSNSGLRQCLSGYRFSSHIVWRTEKEATFHIASSTTDPTVGIPGPSSEIHNWHRPLPIRKGFIATILILPLIVIGILEGLQQASDRHNGFLTLPEDASEHNSTTTVLIHYIPALFMLLVATLFNMLDFTVSTFAPFSALRIGNSPAKRSVFSCLLSELPPIALYRAAIEHHWGALCSNLAGFTGSVLTIIVSGLLVVEKINMATNISVQQLDSFTIDAYNATSSNTTTTLTLIEQFNLSFPIFTYEDLAFPRIKLSHDIPVLEQAANEGSDLSLSVDLPALRPSLDCRTLLEDEITLIFNQSNDEHVDRGPEIVLQAAINLPDGCGGATVNYDFPFPVFDGEKPVTDAPNSDNGWSFAGAIGDLSDVRIDSSECPSLVFFFGSFKMNVISYENVTVMSCSQHMQDVHAFTTFNMSNLNIDPSRPPVVNESTIKLLPNNTSGHTSLWYPVARKFEDNIASFSGSNAYGQLDHFFQTLTLGSDGVPPTELVGPANAPTLLNRVTHLYRKYMVQVINADMRTAPLYPNPTYNATVAQPTARLKQNKGSKITLQILLSVMLACSALAYYLTPHPRHTLPHNPHTLAGSMSLLAGSEMCSRAVVPEGAEWMSDKELKKAGVFEGYLFSLGWWAGDGRRRFGVDMGRAEKA